MQPANTPERIDKMVDLFIVRLKESGSVCNSQHVSTHANAGVSFQTLIAFFPIGGGSIVEETVYAVAFRTSHLIIGARS